MKDSRYFGDDGNPTYVSNLPTKTIVDLLNSPLVIVEPDHESDTVEFVKLRLEIELIIRRNGW